MTKRIEFEDDIVVVYDKKKQEIYRGMEDYDPMKYENWLWDEKTRSYYSGNFKKICLDI